MKRKLKQNGVWGAPWLGQNASSATKHVIPKMQLFLENSGQSLGVSEDNFVVCNLCSLSNNLNEERASLKTAHNYFFSVSVLTVSQPKNASPVMW